MLNIGQNVGRWLGYNYDNKNAVPIGKVNTIIQEDLSSQMIKPIESKPAGYKNSQTSSIRFITDTNLEKSNIK